jgi:hypothetical protein
MDGTVQINIRVRKYLWGEFVHDVCYVLYASIMISNALCKRFFKLSIPQLYHRVVDPVAWVFGSAGSILKSSILILALILFGIIALMFTMGVPIVLFLAATGRIQ